MDHRVQEDGLNDRDLGLICTEDLVTDEIIGIKKVGRVRTK